MVAAALMAAAPPASAQNATWLANPGSGDFNTGSNWNSGTVPTGTAFFGQSNTTSLTFSVNLPIGGWTFNAGASNYSFTNGIFGLLTFNGAGVTVNGGSATITNDFELFFENSSTAGSAAITNNSSLQFISNSTAGSAAITNNTSGVVDFSASTGPTGNNQLSAGSIAGAGAFYLGADQLTVGGNNLSTTVSGVISDCGAGGSLCLALGATGGSLVKVGTGVLKLTGANTYTGATTVDGGALEVDGSIATSSGVTVNAGGTLDGIGSVSSTQVNNGGALAPGNAANPTGTLTIAGNLSFQSAALYMVTIASANTGRTSVNGTAALGGTVQVTFSSAPTAKHYDILHAAGGLGGTTFGGVTATNFDASLSYTSTDVFLNLTAALGAGTPLNQNQRNVVTAINNFSNAGGTLPPGFAGLFNLTGAPLANALTQLDGEDGTGAERGAFELTNQFLSLMLDPFVDGRSSGNGGSSGQPLGFAPDRQTSLPPDIALAYAGVLKAPPPKPQSFDQRWSVWGSAFGGSATANGDATVGSNNVTTSTFGYAAGMDYHYSPSTVLGFALAGGGTNWNLAQGLGGGRSDAFLAGVYGATHEGPAYLAGALSFANNWFTTNRTAVAGDQLSARFQGQSYAARLEGGYRYAATPTLGVTPYAALQAQDFHTPAYSESDLTGGGLGLSYNAMTGTDVRSELGARFDDPTLVGSMPLILRTRLAWAHDCVSNPALNPAFISLPGAGFTVNGAPMPKNSALASAGAQLFFTPQWSLLAKFDGEFASGSQTYAGSGTLRYAW